MAKRAPITGGVGQDGSYLAELLPENGYNVRGISRRASCLMMLEHDLHGYGFSLHQAYAKTRAVVRKVSR